MTTTEQLVVPQALEIAVAQRRFDKFLDFCWLEEVGKGAIPFALWPHIVFLAAILPFQKLFAWLKARQIGCTWLVAAYVVWKAQYHPSEVILLLSRREVDAKVFLRKCLFIYNHLPPHLRVPLVKETTDEMEFGSEGGNSRVIAMPSSPDVGRSYAVSMVVADEADFQDYFDQNFAALTPTIEAGGQFIALSTSAPTKVDSRFKAIYRGGTRVTLGDEARRVPGWMSVFLPWNVVPGRGTEFIQERKERFQLTDFEIEKEYPATEHDALAPARSRMFFDRDALMTIQEKDIREPLEVRRGVVKIWSRAEIGGKYVAFGDNAWGEKGAYSCTTILRYEAGEGHVAAEIYGRMTLDELARLNVDVCKEYNNAFIAIETNGEGITVAKKMIELGYGHRMYHRGPDWRKEDKHIGWWTDSHSRDDMLGEYELRVRGHHHFERCQDALNEHFSFIREEMKNKPMHADGAYDDHVISRAGAWAMVRYALRNGKFSLGATSTSGQPIRLPAIM